MKEWLTAVEIADEALPDLPGSERGIQLLAAREGWNDHPAYARERSGRGGGMEYHFRLLPTLAQIAYAQRHMTVGPVQNGTPAANDPKTEVELLTDRARIERDARLAIVHAYDRFTSGLRNATETARLQIFSDKYAVNSITIEPWVKQAIPSFSKRSLMRWRKAVKAGRTGKLAIDRGQARKGTGLLDVANGGKVQAFIIALIAQQPHLSAERVRVLCQSEFGRTVLDRNGAEKPLPPVRTFQQAIRTLKASQNVLLTQLSNPDRYRSAMAPAGRGSLRHITRPNALWMIDASPLDAMDTEMSRPTVYACIDIATRRTVLYITRTPRASAVALLIRKAILAWGVPEAIKTDNGSDFVAEASKRLLAGLDIELQLSSPYQPQQKGHVERVIGTMQRHFAEMLPGYVGHSVTDRKQLEDRKSFAQRLGAETAELFGVSLTMEEIQDLADRWTDTWYQHHAHSGLGGKTPFEVAQASAAQVKRIDERALDVLLMPVAGKDGYRTVTKLGVRIDGFFYVTFKALPQDRVFVRMDPNDLGLCYLFDADSGRFIECATCPERAGIDPAEFMKAAKRARSELMSELSKPVRDEVKRLTTGPALIERYLDEKAKDRPDPGNVVSLPKREVSHETPELAAALEAATGEKHEPEAEPELTETAPAAVIAFTPRPATGGERPTFRNDVEMAAWLIANPDRITERDRQLMADRLKKWTFAQMLAGAGVDAEALKTLVSKRPQPQEVTQ